MPVSLLPPPPPHPPFLVQMYLSRYPPDQQESILVVAPLALSPLAPPGLGPVDLLNAVRAPFHVHPPHSYAMLVIRLHPNPGRAFCSDQQSVGEPAPRARTMEPGYRACKPQDRYDLYYYASLTMIPVINITIIIL